MFIEPLLIIPTSKYISEWKHPRIDKLTTELHALEGEDGKTNLIGNLIRFKVTFEDEMSVNIIVITDSEGVTEIISEHGITTYIRHLSTMFGDSTWLKEFKPFHKTEYGKIFNKVYPMFSKNFDLSVIKNVSLVNDGDNWWFS